MRNLSLLVGVIAATASAAVLAAGASAAPQTFTPVIMDSVAEPRWFRGIDNRVHLEYELRLTNGLPVDVTVTKLVARRRPDGGKLIDLSGDELAAAISPVAEPSVSGARLSPSSASFAYLDITVGNPRRLPTRIVHTITTEADPGLPIPATNVDTGAKTLVHQGPPVRIDAPLSGPSWAAIIGAHRRAVQPVNGIYRNGQRYAIDWNRLDAENRPAFGDPASFSSNPSYGAAVLAVGDAKVVQAVDGIADQPPDSFTPVGLDQADGNYVILKLSKGVYAGYAHLIPGTVAVKRGDTVESGDKLGELGNSGNSDGPHLHFQMMTAPSLLASDALPFELRRFRLRGIVPSLDAFGQAYVGQTPVPFSTDGAGPYRNRGPVGLDILDLP